VKQIPPAIQESEHYLKFKVNGEEKELGQVVDSVWTSVTEFMGVQGASEADIWIIGNKFDEDAQTGVIRVRRDKVDDVRAALTLRPGFEDKSFISVERVSGTISGLD
jgi:RNase P/RNase MRP subunit POP5